MPPKGGGGQEKAKAKAEIAKKQKARQCIVCLCVLFSGFESEPPVLLVWRSALGYVCQCPAFASPWKWGNAPGVGASKVKAREG